MIILGVDDDNDDLEIFREALREVNASFQCITARNGLEALELLNGKLLILPDYIFLDINMPFMDGRQCLLEIKKQENLKDIPVVMYSTTSHAHEIKDYLQLGAREFVIKPPTFQKLVEALQYVLR
jgi:CheY-like chemotaxis protein